MKKKKHRFYQTYWFWITIIVIAVLIGVVTYITTNRSVETNTNNKEAEQSKVNMTAEEIVNKLKEKGLSIGEIVVYTEETDLNNLLGRPNQYIAKIDFADTRIKQPKKVNEKDLKKERL